MIHIEEASPDGALAPPGRDRVDQDVDDGEDRDDLRDAAARRLAAPAPEQGARHHEHRQGPPTRKPPADVGQRRALRRHIPFRRRVGTARRPAAPPHASPSPRSADVRREAMQDDSQSPPPRHADEPPGEEVGPPRAPATSPGSSTRIQDDVQHLTALYSTRGGGRGHPRPPPPSTLASYRASRLFVAVTRGAASSDCADRPTAVLARPPARPSVTGVHVAREGQRRVADRADCSARARPCGTLPISTSES